MENLELLLEEYKILSNLELETTKLRNRTFTTFLSVSFLIPGFVVKTGLIGQENVIWYNDFPKLVFLLGFLFYLLALLHYHWFHRYSVQYRERLIELEIALGFKIYQLRARPKARKIELRYDFALYIVGIIYLVITCIISGWWTTLLIAFGSVAIYFLSCWLYPKKKRLRYR